jgi:hypothetical protein
LPEGCVAVLPSEAEWEYACRAGTQTPFSFGEQIDPSLVNYNGNIPYAGGKAGEYREKTIPVKSLPPNAWGLYEMHGNVLEWCGDYLGAYSAEPAIDPRGDDRGSSRAVRGGSWINYARRARSAFRHDNERGSRVHHLGFRFALRSTEPGRGAQRVGISSAAEPTRREAPVFPAEPGNLFSSSAAKPPNFFENRDQDRPEEPKGLGDRLKDFWKGSKSKSKSKSKPKPKR